MCREYRCNRMKQFKFSAYVQNLIKQKNVLDLNNNSKPLTSIPLER